METIHKLEYRIRDLPTRSVTLFPSRAQVVRDIKDVPLKVRTPFSRGLGRRVPRLTSHQPGATQITVVGLSPTVDEHSIKVEGTGSAIISDITVEFLPNRDIFQEIYPDSDDDKSEGESEDAEDEEPSKDSAEIDEVRRKLTGLRDHRAQVEEQISSAASRLKILDAFVKALDHKRGVQIDATLETYRKERGKVFQDHINGFLQERRIDENIADLAKVEGRLLRLKTKEEQKAAKAKAKAQKAKEKKKEKERRREAVKQKEKDRIRKEHESFWPHHCYTVRITLDAANFTPMSSRRGSVSSVTEITKVVPEKETPQTFSGEDGSPATCDISLSYVTSSAFWRPTYDLQLSTTSNTAMLCFDARLTNMTSESWDNCKVVLSTSQTTFSGLSDNIPTLVPWRVKLARGHGVAGILNSREEISQKGGWQVQQNAWLAQKPRSQLFGAPPGALAQASSLVPLAVEAKKAAPAPVHHKTIALSGGSLFGGASGSPFPASGPGFSSIFGRPEAVQRDIIGNTASTHGLFGMAAKSEENTGFGLFDDGVGDGATILPEPIPELEFQESSIEETGMTTTYDLPGLKTLTPSSTASKQRVARISFSGVTFGHTIVAKYKPAAFLKAALRNASKLTLLKGEVGLTLDGSFLGRSTLPRCSAGDKFTIGLGVDPAIQVGYPKPEVRRATTGVFSKESTSVYKRTITITNTRTGAGKSVTLVLLDQAPVSEDEKLRIDILQPRGMTAGGVGVPVGVSPKDEKDWGSAKASLKKAGEISWDISLAAGKTVRLALEYEVVVAAGEGIIEC